MKLDSNISFAVVYLIFVIIQLLEVIFYAMDVYQKGGNYKDLLKYSFIKPLLLMICFALILFIYIGRYYENNYN